MKTAGIIAEFNPFHDGHRYLIQRVREEAGAGRVVAVMSGDFTQRGYPAAEDKWIRAEKAVRSGVDLVLELPAVYSCASAPYFASAGVGILEGTGIVDLLAFGSESGEAEWFRSAASFFREHREQVNALTAELTRKGMSYPSAREQAARDLHAGFSLEELAEPNNILGLEYASCARTMELFTVRRRGSGHHETGTMLREKMRMRQPERFRQAEAAYFHLAAAKILETEESVLENVASAGGGLGHLLKKRIRDTGNVDELIDCVKSKVYTRTRISRMIAQTLLGVTKADLESGVLYARVLAAGEAGTAFLRQAAEVSGIPILTNINREADRYPAIRRLLSVDILASDLYNLIWGNDLYQSSDFIKHPYIVAPDRPGNEI